MKQKQQQNLSYPPNSKRHTMEGGGGGCGGEISEKSRVCVKNLPKYLTLDRFKAHFSQIGDLTDAMLLRTKEGRSRRMGFVGYRTEQQAVAAIKFFNKSYVDTSRITCEFGWKSGDSNIPRPWSRYSKQKEISNEKKFLVSGLDAKRERKTDNKIDDIDDPKFQEFLQVMRPCSKRKFWADDLQAPMNKLLNVDVTAQYACSMHHENQTKSLKMACDSAVTDVDYFKSRIRKDWSDSDSDSEEIRENINQDDGSPDRENQMQQDFHKKCDSEKQECLLKDGLCDESVKFGNQSCNLDRMLQTCRIYVWNLPYAATEDEVVEFFNKFGKVKDVHLVIDKETKQPRGFGYVHYSTPEDAARALGDQIFQGRCLHVVQAENARGLHNTENHVPEGKGKTYKQHREEKRKTLESNGDTRAWNSLFMRADTIVENMARKYGVSKSVILDREADDAAVRIALGEVNIIADTKKALAEAGVNVASLEEFAARKSEGAKRSNHVLLVKNLPFSSSKGELYEMFGRFGSLDNVIFPPTRTLALVIFIEPAEARVAFNCLRYKRYRDSLLYLEWAPSNTLCDDPVPSADSKNDVAIKIPEAKEILLEEQLEEMNQVEIDSEGAELRTLYVKLNFETTDEKLWKYFRENMIEGKILSAKVVKHLKDGKSVSSGYGFVEFDSIKTASNVLRVLQGTILDGHALELQLSHPKKDTDALQRIQKGRSSTKLIIKNLPFEATSKELRQLFSPFGWVKGLRLPNNVGGRKHKGFAFVEYNTKQEAENALKALSRIHVYGRPMIIERAKEDKELGLV